jgi:glyoxylase-like metal-dependent hydrolase (beta-lactamase superfamily II)
VTLLPHVLRLTAPNPGPMTGPGTNSYLVGHAHIGFIVIDPGPDAPTHIERLWQATGGDIRAIVCTHSHADHAPAARPLQALCAQRGDSPPVLGLPSAASARPASHFAPDRHLGHDEQLQLKHGDSRHTLRVLHTPGHAANHLCLLLEEDRLLFSGDHILSGSTTVIDPPDGDMTAYLDSLDLLGAACAQHAVEFILPAHGHVLDEAPQAIAGLKAHRLRREAKILRAMQAQPLGTLDDWLPQAYDDVPEPLWPLARRSLLAHVQRLQTLPPDNDNPRWTP